MADLDQSHVGECGREIPLSNASTHFMIIKKPHPSECIVYVQICMKKVAATRVYMITCRFNPLLVLWLTYIHVYLPI